MANKIYSLEEYNDLYKVLYIFYNLYKTNVDYYMNKYNLRYINPIKIDANNFVKTITYNNDFYTINNILYITDNIYIFKLQKSKYICVSNFVTFIYNASNNTIFNLNSVCKKHFNLKGDVYLNTYVPKKILSVLFKDPILFIPQGLTSTSTYQILPKSIKEVLQEFKHYYKMATINSGVNTDTLYYNMYICDLTKFQSIKSNKKLIFPFSYFGRDNKGNIECAYLILDMKKEKIIFPKKENIIDMFKNKFLLKDGTFIKNKYYEKYYNTSDQTILFSLAEENKKLLNYIKNIDLQNTTDKSYYSLFTPLFLTKLITPVLHKITNSENKLSTITFNKDIYEAISFIITNKLNNIITYNDINSLFSYNIYDNLNYINDVCLLPIRLQAESKGISSYYKNYRIISYYNNPSIRPFKTVTEQMKKQVIDGETFIYTDNPNINILKELYQDNIIEMESLTL